MRASTRIGVVCALLAASAALAFAHDTWLLPSSLRVQAGQTVTLHLTSGETFPVDDLTIDPARVTRALVRMRGTNTPLTGATSAKAALQYAWKPTRTGVAVIGIELAPKLLTLAPDKIEEYFADINANAETRAAWKAIASPKQWRESYSKHAKTYVRVGDGGADTSWKRPLGFALELVPLSDPTAVAPGGSLRVRAMRNGAPLAGLEVGLQGPGITGTQFHTTDRQGDVTLVFPREGLWLVNGTSLRRTTKAGLEWESDFATMTLAVGR